MSDNYIVKVMVSQYKVLNIKQLIYLSAAVLITLSVLNLLPINQFNLYIHARFKNLS